MFVQSLHRYPVKSLRGEDLSTAQLTADGIAGDRVVHVRGDRGPLTGRTRHGLLTIPASTGVDGVPMVAGHRWDSQEAAELIRDGGGPDARLAAYDGPERFDIHNLLVATDGTIEALGIDARRLRPNLVIGGVDGLDERSWEGRALAIGEVLIGISDLRQRCIVTTIDPDTGAQDVDVLRDIARRFASRVALNCWVIQPGTFRLGDRVELVDVDERPARRGGWILGAPYLPSP